MSQVWTWPPVELSDGAVEAMKWLGLILMTADHAQKYGLMPAIPGIYEAGQVAFPLFGIVLAYNLARVRSHDRAVYVRVLTRLLVCCAMASLFTIEIPRASRWFYLYYPAHLAIILLLGFRIQSPS